MVRHGACIINVSSADHVSGDIIYLNVLGKRLVVLGSHEAAHNILEKQSVLTADRPPSTMVKL